MLWIFVWHWIAAWKLVREGKNEHQHAADVRADIRSIASQPERAGAPLVQWSIDHPDGKLPSRHQVHTRKQYTWPAQLKDKNP